MAERIRGLAPDAALGMAEKNVFGARCWMLDGNMAFGVHDDDLLVRLGAPAVDAVIAEGRARPFDPVGQGRPMAHYAVVDAEDVAEDDALLEWLVRAIDFTARLPEAGHGIRRRAG